MVKRLAILNFISVILAVFIGYYTQAIQLNGNTMGSLSAKYYNLFTPAPYAFAIWGLIYLSLLVCSSYDLIQVYKKEGDTAFLLQSGYWYLVANLANSVWVIVWLYELTALSVVVMLTILFSLGKIITKTNMNLTKSSIVIKLCSVWPISIYAGWITVATIANIAAYLAKIGWTGGWFTEVQWTVVMIITATLVNIVVLFKRNMNVFVLVALWSLAAIYQRHLAVESAIVLSTQICFIVLLLAIVTQLFLRNKQNKA